MNLQKINWRKVIGVGGTASILFFWWMWIVTIAFCIPAQGMMFSIGMSTAQYSEEISHEEIVSNAFDGVLLEVKESSSTLYNDYWFQEYFRFTKGIANNSIKAGVHAGKTIPGGKQLGLVFPFLIWYGMFYPLVRPNSIKRIIFGRKQERKSDNK